MEDSPGNQSTFSLSKIRKVLLPSPSPLPPTPQQYLLCPTWARLSLQFKNTPIGQQTQDISQVLLLYAKPDTFQTLTLPAGILKGSFAVSQCSYSTCQANIAQPNPVLCPRTTPVGHWCSVPSTRNLQNSPILARLGGCLSNENLLSCFQSINLPDLLAGLLRNNLLNYLFHSSIHLHSNAPKRENKG